MTRQCAWCERYLSFGRSGVVTHGICDHCAEKLRQSIPHRKTAPASSSHEFLKTDRTTSDPLLVH
jgi:hypothetical protein